VAPIEIRADRSLKAVDGAEVLLVRIAPVDAAVLILGVPVE